MNSIKLKKDYQLVTDYLKIRSNHREQLILLYALHLLTGDEGSELVESYLEMTMPIDINLNERGYSSLTSHRSKRRAHLNYLMSTYFVEKKKSQVKL